MLVTKTLSLMNESHVSELRMIPDKSFSLYIIGSGKEGNELCIMHPQHKKTKCN